ncbi:AraC family transcriptional regulator [Pseudomonas sp. GOM6]|uniref:helix-turn-helix domain-containing protein n=1 Tax=Pseudomonas sp. GOM6 TaxID=3036944 RepID=UPI0024090FE1|nr:AraC family transcriptional regulator [Pseudomonas sp. GOM6]MDG1579734.1 AraC family transcriptional regulator [Pseudomonas sp. GOM6]
MGSIRLARLGNLDVACSSVVGQQFEKHSHDEFVIGANLLGEELIWLDGRSFTAGVGAITTYNPGEIQGGGARAGLPWRYVSLYIPPEQLAIHLGQSSLQFERPLQQAPGLASELAQAVGLCLSDDALLRERGEECVTLLLGRIASGAGVRLSAPRDAGSGAVRRLQELLAARLEYTPSLDQMAAELGLSKFHLLRSFQRHTGLSPRQWAMQLRTRRAQGLLRQGFTAAEVAHTLGFADQSHLTRHFRAAYGLPPGRYQALVRE